MKKRLVLYALTLFATSFITTKAVVGMYPRFLTVPSMVRIGFLYLFLLMPVLWSLVNFGFRISNVRTPHLKSHIRYPKFTEGGIVAFGGAIAAWILQIIELKLYHFEKRIQAPIDLLGDECVRSWTMIFPALLVAELLWLFLKDKSKWYLVGLGALIVGSSGFALSRLAAVDSTLKVYGKTLESAPKKPNIVLIVADDLGYGDISLHGNELIQTPNIDAIAKEGVDFTRGYVSASVCAPSRAALLTGQYQQRHGFEFLTDPFENLPRTRISDFERFGNEANFKAWYKPSASIRARGLDPSVKTIANYLKEDGYATAVIGKWHLGAHPRFDPKFFGFDQHYGIVGAGSLYAPLNDSRIIESRHDWDFADFAAWQNMYYYVQENGKQSVPEGKPYLTDYFTQKAVQYIEENKKNRFFLHLAYTAPHGPFQAQKTYYDKLSHIKDHNKRVYCAMIQNLDDAIGQVKEKLAKEGLLDNTIILFSSDNGGATYTRACNNQPFYGGKMSDFEGGLVVPFLMQWKGHIKPNTTYANSVSLLDILPTVLAATNSKAVTAALDGVDLIPFLDGKTAANKHPHDVLYWRTGFLRAIQKDSFKLHINAHDHYKSLHNIVIDPSEKVNLFDKYPEKVQELDALWQKWAKDLPSPRWSSNANVAIPATNEANAKHYFFPW
jgi:arylsulfatase A-like enzyme